MRCVKRTFVALSALVSLASLADAKPSQRGARADASRVLTLQRSELEIDGELEPRQLQPLLGPFELTLSECLDRSGVKAPRLGRAVLQLAIGDHGGVLSALVRDSELEHRVIEQCIADQARDWMFGLKLAEPVLVTLPFVIEPETPERKRTRAPRERGLPSLFGRDSALGAAATAAIAGMDGSELTDAYSLGEIVKLGRSGRHPGPLPDVRAGTPTVSHGLTAYDVQHMTGLRLNELRLCYELGRATDPRLTGSMTVQFVITARGKSTDSRIVSSTASEKHLQQCVLAALRRWTYPRPADQAEVTVTQELTFFVPAAP